MVPVSGGRWTGDGLQLPASVRAVVFDFNGVLLWDGYLQDRAWGEYSARLRGAPLSSEEMAWHVHGRYNRHTFEYLLGRRLEQNELARMTEEKEQIYRRLCLAEASKDPGSDGHGFRLSPGAVDVLDRLVALGIPHTIATASGRGNVDFFVEHLGLERWFDPAAIAYDDGTRPGKPAPDLYLHAARLLGQPPAHCLVVEDARAGIEAARRAGIGHVIALGPRSEHEALRRLPGVDRAVESLEELLS
jgi:beta-phosphoglucomutase-like phosphatase (HAD superfamily)